MNAALVRIKYLIAQNYNLLCNNHHNIKSLLSINTELQIKNIMYWNSSSNSNPISYGSTQFMSNSTHELKGS